MYMEQSYIYMYICIHIHIYTIHIRIYIYVYTHTRMYTDTPLFVNTSSLLRNTKGRDDFVLQQYMQYSIFIWKQKLQYEGRKGKGSGDLFLCLHLCVSLPASHTHMRSRARTCFFLSTTDRNMLT
jgi:hypothetical protein